MSKGQQSSGIKCPPLTHLTDIGPTCPHCRQVGLFGYALSIANADTAYAQCGSCLAVDRFRMRLTDPTIADFRTVHGAHLDEQALIRVGWPRPFNAVFFEDVNP